MKIGIDGRLIYQTGVGRYIRNLLDNLARIDHRNEYRIFLGRNAFPAYQLPNKRWQKRLADIRWHTFKEQMVMPRILSQEKLDLVHIPYFNIPILYSRPMIVTIHDLTILHFATGRATTLPKALYITRRLGYLLNLAIGLRKALKIITVSNATKNDIMKSCHIPQDKIVVTYEGIDQTFRYPKTEINNRNRLISEDYFLYVGNAYPHKNLGKLLAAYSLLLKQIDSKKLPKLVFVGADDFFYSRLKYEVRQRRLEKNVMFFGADDTQLVNLYSNALALVFTSLAEGFGLPAVEALSCRCPVLCSDIAVFHEILGSSPIYFNPLDERDIMVKMKNIWQMRVADKKNPSVVFDSQRFSWETMARQTLNTYESCTRL